MADYQVDLDELVAQQEQTDLAAFVEEFEPGEHAPRYLGQHGAADTRQQSLYAFDDGMTVDGFNVLSISSNQENEYVMAPWICLHTTFDGNDLYHTFNTSGGTGKSFADIHRYQAAEHDEDVEPVTYPDSDFRWGPGPADVLQASFDAAGASIGEAHIFYDGGEAGIQTDQDTRIDLYTEEGDYWFTADTGAGLLAAALSGAEITAEDAIWTSEAGLRDELSFSPLTFADYRDAFLPLDGEGYEASPVDLDADTVRWEVDGYPQPTLDPQGSMYADVSGVLGNVKRGSRPNQFLISEVDGDEERTVPFTPNILSEVAFKQYMQEDDNNCTALSEQAFGTLRTAEWPDIVAIMLGGSDVSSGPVVELLNEADAYPVDEDEETLHAAAPTDLYFRVEDDHYAIPPHGFQSIVLSIAPEFAVVDNYHGLPDEHDQSFM